MFCSGETIVKLVHKGNIDLNNDENHDGNVDVDSMEETMEQVDDGIDVEKVFIT